MILLSTYYFLVVNLVFFLYILVCVNFCEATCYIINDYSMYYVWLDKYKYKRVYVLGKIFNLELFLYKKLYGYLEKCMIRY